MSNRIESAIAKIREKADTLTEEERAKLDREMAVSFDEHFAYQNAQARAHAMGVLTTDEALIIYTALGEVGSSDNGGWAAGTELATKVAITLTMGELLTAVRRTR